ADGSRDERYVGSLPCKGRVASKASRVGFVPHVPRVPREPPPCPPPFGGGIAVDRPGQRRVTIRIDHVAGAIFIVLGIAILAISGDLPIGNLSFPGAGMMPTLVGTLVGVLPGIGPLSGISILLPITFGLDATKAIIMLAGIYYGSQYGGSTTSILMRIPGEASSVMTCIDGYAMAQKGRAGAALCIAAVGSFVAGTFGVLVLTLIAPPLAAFALRFGPPEYTALLVLGLVMLAYLSSTALSRTLLMAVLGLLLGAIGIDNMTGHFRYSFDIAELGDGIGIVPVAVGLFGLGEILATPSAAVIGKVIAPKLCELLPSRREWRDSGWPIARGSVLGFLIGLTPGSAHIISSFLSYAVERRV